uniref:Uncharacterized protein n=1 Tax=Ditylenchus dipsaci TaxID=166011 RepID=A0A915EJC8_9BILA
MTFVEVGFRQVLYGSIHHESSSLWRTTGLTYIRFSQIAAQVARDCKKAVAGAKDKPKATVTFTDWQNGKPMKAQE